MATPRRPYVTIALGTFDRCDAISDAAQLLLARLFTHRDKRSVPGLLRLGLAGLSESLNVPKAKTQRELLELERAGRVLVDTRERLIYVVGAIDGDGPRTENAVRGMAAQVSELPPHSPVTQAIRRAITAALARGENEKASVWLATWRELVGPDAGPDPSPDAHPEPRPESGLESGPHARGRVPIPRSEDRDPKSAAAADLAARGRVSHVFIGRRLKVSAGQHRLMLDSYGDALDFEALYPRWDDDLVASGEIFDTLVFIKQRAAEQVRLLRALGPTHHVDPDEEARRVARAAEHDRRQQELTEALDDLWLLTGEAVRQQLRAEAAIEVKPFQARMTKEARDQAIEAGAKRLLAERFPTRDARTAELDRLRQATIYQTGETGVLFRGQAGFLTLGLALAVPLALALIGLVVVLASVVRHPRSITVWQEQEREFGVTGIVKSVDVIDATPRVEHAWFASSEFRLLVNREDGVNRIPNDLLHPWTDEGDAPSWSIWVQRKGELVGERRGHYARFGIDSHLVGGCLPPILDPQPRLEARVGLVVLLNHVLKANRKVRATSQDRHALADVGGFRGGISGLLGFSRHRNHVFRLVAHDVVLPPKQPSLNYKQTNGQQRQPYGVIPIRLLVESVLFFVVGLVLSGVRSNNQRVRFRAALGLCLILLGAVRAWLTCFVPATWGWWL